MPNCTLEALLITSVKRSCHSAGGSGVTSKCSLITSSIAVAHHCLERRIEASVFLWTGSTKAFNVLLEGFSFSDFLLVRFTILIPSFVTYFQHSTEPSCMVSPPFANLDTSSVQTPKEFTPISLLSFLPPLLA